LAARDQAGKASGEVSLVVEETAVEVDGRSISLMSGNHGMTRVLISKKDFHMYP